MAPRRKNGCLQRSNVAGDVCLGDTALKHNHNHNHNKQTNKQQPPQHQQEEEQEQEQQQQQHLSTTFQPRFNMFQPASLLFSWVLGCVPGLSFP
jgi:hypothetical protein